MTTEYEYSHPYDHQSIIENALVGRRIVAVSDIQGEDYEKSATLTLDNGTTLEMQSRDGGCSCSAGCYELTHFLTDIPDNIITAVHFEDSPDSEDAPEGEGRYSIYVFTGNDRINLATFDGTDGNGYYGTGYSIAIRNAS